MKRCIIMLAGAILLSEREKDDIIICADSGALSLKGSDIEPDHIVGDMDSLPVDILSGFEASGTQVHRYPVEKDLSDGELCINMALELKPDEILIYGGKNGRADHVLSSYHLLSLIPRKIPSSLFLGEDLILLLREGDERELKTSAKIVSILPAYDECVVTLKGLKWELEKKRVELGSTLGIHNEINGPTFSVKVISGSLYLMMMDEI